MPFGEIRGTAPTWANDKGFVGGTTDPTGLTHLGAREYDPTAGRFLSDDPITDANDPQQMHGYAYANNSPTSSSDAGGLKPCDTGDDCTHMNTYKAYNVPQPTLRKSNGCAHNNAYANYYCSGSPSGPSLQEAQEQYWGEQYEAVVAELQSETGKGDLFTDPNLPVETTAAFQAEADQRFCERIGGATCADGMAYIISAGSVVGIGASGGVYSQRAESRNIVADSADRQIQRGWGTLMRDHLSRKQQLALQGDLERGEFWRYRMYAGTALHNAVGADLQRTYRGRFVYNKSYGPDYFDTKNGVRVELTTRFAFKRHWYRPDARYRSAVYVLYRGPGLPPERR